jgi:hypothetical protein
MCFALFIASSSIFLARQHLSPALLRKTGVLFLLSFLPLMLMIFWLIRLSLSNRQGRRFDLVNQSGRGERFHLEHRFIQAPGPFQEILTRLKSRSAPERPG